MGKHSASNNSIPMQRDELIQRYQASHNGATPPGMVQPQPSPQPDPQLPTTPPVGRPNTSIPTPPVSAPAAPAAPATTIAPLVEATSVQFDGNVPLFGRKQEILRLREENARLNSDNEKLRARNTELNNRGQQLHAELETATAEANRLGAMDVSERKAELDGLDRRIREEQARLESDVASRREKIGELEGDINRRKEEIASLDSQLIDLRNHLELNDMGLYDFENPAEDSVKLREQLAANKEQQKQMVKDKSAVRMSKSFTMNGSSSLGRQFMNNMSQMALSLFNAEAENAVKSVKAGNLDTSVARLQRCSDRIARFGKTISLEISKKYFNLRVKELTLTAMYMQAVKAEKEAERERRAELREAQKAQKELEAEMARLRKEQEHYQNVLEKMREKGDTEEVAKLEARLAEIDKSVSDVDYRAANIRAGYVYVISDIGAFGERMVKIGMTRRLDPLDRVRELSGASVPFKFDVHALFFSKDAVGLETMLHHEFADRRVNRVNSRKEFFYCTPQEVLDKLKEKNVAVVEYRVEPEAEEYRLSQSIAEKQQG